MLLPEGGFEGGAAGWSLTGGAAVRTGNEPFFVRAGTDERSLRLPAGSSATSPPMCVGFAYPTMRLFARTTGDEDSRLAVHVRFRLGDGVERSVRIAELEAGERWAPTRAFWILANLLAYQDGPQQITFRFSPTGGEGSWDIDDVYVDPYAR